MYGRCGNLWGSPSIMAPRMEPSRFTPRFPCYVDLFGRHLAIRDHRRLDPAEMTLSTSWWHVRKCYTL
jgi:hypothetical protein